MEKTLNQKAEDREEEIFYSPTRMDEKNKEIQSNDDEEKKKIDQLREIVAKQDPACKVLPPSHLIIYNTFILDTSFYVVVFTG